MKKKYEFKLEDIRKKYHFRVRWRADGGKGSGNWGHAGRPGEVGGSQPNESAAFNHRYIDAKTGEYTSFAKEKKKAATPHKATKKELDSLPIGARVIDGKSVFKKVDNSGDYGYDWYDVYTGEVFDTATMEKEHLSGNDIKVAIPASSEAFMKEKVYSEGSMFGGKESGEKKEEKPKEEAKEEPVKEEPAEEEKFEVPEVTDNESYKKAIEMLTKKGQEVGALTKNDYGGSDILKHVKLGISAETLVDYYAGETDAEKAEFAKKMSEYTELYNSAEKYINKQMGWSENDDLAPNPWKDMKFGGDKTSGEPSEANGEAIKVPEITDDDGLDEVSKLKQENFEKIASLTDGYDDWSMQYEFQSQGNDPKEIIEKHCSSGTKEDKEALAKAMSDYVEYQNATTKYLNNKWGWGDELYDNPWKDLTFEDDDKSSGEGSVYPEIKTEEEYDEVLKDLLPKNYSESSQMTGGIDTWGLNTEVIYGNDPKEVIEKYCKVKTKAEKEKLAKLASDYVEYKNALIKYNNEKNGWGDPMLDNPWKDLTFEDDKTSAESSGYPEIKTEEDFYKASDALSENMSEVKKLTGTDDSWDLSWEYTAEHKDPKKIIENHCKGKSKEEKEKLAKLMSDYVECHNAQKKYNNEQYGWGDKMEDNPWKGLTFDEPAAEKPKKVAVKDVEKGPDIPEIASDEDYDVVHEIYSDISDDIYSNSKKGSYAFELQDDFEAGEDPHDVIEKYCNSGSAEDKAKMAANMSQYVAIQNAVAEWMKIKYGSDIKKVYDDPWKDLEFEDTPQKTATQKTGVSVPLGKSFEPSTYSDERVTNAREHTTSDSYAAFAPTTSAVWQNLDDDQRYWLWRYTDGSRFVNEPLTGRKYYGSKSGTTEAIENLTSAIDQAEVPVDCKLIHGIGNGGARKIFNIPKDEDIEEAVKARIGEVGYNGAFMSCGVDTDTNGYAYGQPVLIEVYVPQGAKGVYCEPFSQYGLHGNDHADWDGELGWGWENQTTEGENELILQRGGYLKIRGYKTRKGYPCIVCDLVGQDPDRVKPEDWEKNID